MPDIAFVKEIPLIVVLPLFVILFHMKFKMNCLLNQTESIGKTQIYVMLN